MVKKYEEIKKQYNKIVDAITAKEAQDAVLANFIKELRAGDGFLQEFDSRLWGCLVDFVTVGRKKEIKVTFKDGTEIQA